MKNYPVIFYENLDSGFAHELAHATWKMGKLALLDRFCACHKENEGALPDRHSGGIRSDQDLNPTDKVRAEEAP